MSTRAAVESAVRSWLLLAASATDGQIIKANEKGPRPASPYLTVRVTSDVQDGESQIRNVLGRTLTVTGGTTGTVYTVTVNGSPAAYTRQAGDTDALAAAGLAAAIVAADPDVFASVDGAALVVSPLSGALTVSEADPNLTLDSETVAVELEHGTARAVVSINGYGATAEGWLSTAQRSLRLDAIQARNDADGVTIRADGALTDVAAMLDTSVEPRWLLEAEVTYAYASSGEALVALGTLSIAYTGEIYPSSPDPLTDTLTVEV